MADHEEFEAQDSPKEDEPVFGRKDSVFDEAEVKLNSVWATLKDKPTSQDTMYADQEKEIYDGQLLPTRSEIQAWYLYDWANSPMYNVVAGLVMPIYLSSLALQYGCLHETKYGCDVNYEPIQEDTHVQVYMGSWAFKPTAFVQVMIGFSGAIQAITYIGIGALADYSHYQYYGFLICTSIASIMLFVFFFLGDPSAYLFVGWWYATLLCFLGLALIFYNAYLPLIVENHWIVRRVRRNRRPAQQICQVKQQLADDISQYGVACGYLGSLLMTMIATVVFAMTETTEYEQLTGFGSTTGTTSYDEEWLRAVHQVSMRFDDSNLVQIQLAYDDIDIDGETYGVDTSSHPLQTYSIPNDDYITSIEFWTNSDDQSIHSMRFLTQADTISDIYGPISNTSANSPDQTASVADDTEHHFIFAGYTVYASSNGETIKGMDVVMLNQETGQFQSTIGSRTIILLVFIWWNVFQLITFKYLKRRDGPPLPAGSNPFTFSAMETYHAIKSAADYPNLFRYLLAWFCFSDGLNTLSVTAVLFATSELNFSTTEAGVLFLEALFLGSWGGVFFLWLQRKLQWDSKQMLLLHICLFLIICLYSMLGLIQHIPFGLVSKGELYVFVFVYGMNWGSIQSYARSVFAYLVPIGRESQMFSLYEITDKGSSWIGPIMVAIITNHANIRWGLFYVTSFFAIAAPILHFGVDIQEGMKQAGRWIVEDSPCAADGTIKYKDQTQMVISGTVEDEAQSPDNYNEAKLKIQVTSLDEDEEKEQEKDTKSD